MKWTSVHPSVLVLMLFMGTVAFAAPQISAAVQANPSAMGFENYGQYIAATHVSDSLNISPDTLRTEMVDNQLSLGDAIKKTSSGVKQPGHAGGGQERRSSRQKS